MGWGEREESLYVFLFFNASSRCKGKSTACYVCENYINANIKQISFNYAFICYEANTKFGWTIQMSAKFCSSGVKGTHQPSSTVLKSIMYLDC